MEGNLGPLGPSSSQNTFPVVNKGGLLRGTVGSLEETEHAERGVATVVDLQRPRHQLTTYVSYLPFLSAHKQADMLDGWLHLPPSRIHTRMKPSPASYTHAELNDMATRLRVEPKLTEGRSKATKQQLYDVVAMALGMRVETPVLLF